MELIYADNNRIEQGYLLNIKADVDIGEKNDFEISMNLKRNLLKKGMCWYSPNTEYGGIVRGLKIDTKENRICYYGPSWRGELANKTIKPLQGDDYRIVSGNDIDIIQSFLDEFSISSLFTVSGTATSIVSFKFDRYCSFLCGINKMLAAENKKLLISYDTSQRKAVLSVADIANHSDEAEFSSDGNYYVTIEDNNTIPTHLICLGKGDLAAREVIDLYRDEKNAISKTQTFFGLDDITEIYDANNSETLEADGINHFNELIKTKTIEVDVNDIDLDLYDIVGAREYVTGIYAEKQITNKIFSVSSDGIATIQYKTGDRSLL